MKQGIFTSFVVLTICIASGASFYYLNTVDLSKSSRLITQIQEAMEVKHKRVVIRDPNTNKTQIIIIEPPSWLDSTKLSKKSQLDARKDTEVNSSDQGMLPDVEFLKFVIEKSREGIPVLSIGNLLNFL